MLRRASSGIERGGMDDRERLQRLEQAMQGLQSKLESIERWVGLPQVAAPASEASAAASEASSPSASASELPPQRAAASFSLSEAEGRASPSVSEASAASPPARNIETEAGVTWASRVGAITLVLGLAFFLKHAIDNEWIGPAGRVILGVAVGAALLALGERARRRDEGILAQALSGGGVAALYLSFYASFGFYRLVPFWTAFALMGVTTGLAAALSIRSRSLALAILGLAGGYATPILLSTGVDHPIAFFAYVATLNAGALWAGHVCKWHTLDWLAFLSTGVLFLLWGAEHLEPEKRWIAIAALTIFLGQLALLVAVLRERRWPGRLHVDARVLLALSTVYVAVAGAIVLQDRAIELFAWGAAVVVGLLALAAWRNLRELPIALWLPASILFGAAAAATEWRPFVGGEGMLVAGYPIAALAVALAAACAAWIWVAERRGWLEGVGVAVAAVAVVLGFAAQPLAHGPHLALMTVFWALFLGWAVTDVARRGGSIPGLSVLAANAGLYYAGAYVHVDEMRPDLLGAFTVAVAVPHLGLGAWAVRSPVRRRGALLALGVALSLLTLAVPVQLAGFRITVAWALQGLALLWIARRADSFGTRIASTVVLALAVVRVAAWDLPAVELPSGGSLGAALANGPALAVLATAVALAIGAWLTSKPSERFETYDRATSVTAFVLANVLAAAFLALESYVASGALRPGGARESLSATLTSISWGVWAVTLVGLGMARSSRPVRIAGLALVALTVAKVYALDVWMLGRTERIFAFVALGVLLLGASFAYARFRARLGALVGVALAVLVVPDLARADLDVSRFRSQRPIEVGAPGLVRAPLPVGVYPGARADLADLRVVDDRGRETPFVLREEPSAGLRPVIGQEIRDHVLLEDGVQFVVDVGPSRRRHDRLHLWTPDVDFRRRVRLESSHDGAVWAVARQRAWIFDFSGEPDRHAALTEIDYPVSTAQYLRVTVWNDGGPPLRVTNVTVRLFEPLVALRHVAWSGRPEPAVRPEPRRTVFEIDLGREGIPQDGIELATVARDFQRAVHVESRPDAEASWSPVGSGVVYRIGVDGVDDVRLQMFLPETRGRFLRVTIEDRDDAPIAVSSVRVTGTRRDVLLRAEAGRRYRLLYGFPDARPGSYDLGDVLARQSRIDAAAATVGARARNSQFRPPEPAPKPLTDRWPILFWAVLGAAVVVLALWTVRLLRRATPEAG